MSVTAIDVLLDPDWVMVEKASVANAALRASYPAGFALDDSHAPHITVLQRFVRTADLDEVGASVAEVFSETRPATLELEASGYYYLPWQDLGLAGIAIVPTGALLGLQQSIIDAVRPFTVSTGGREALFGAPDTPTVAPTIAYVESFVPNASGPNYNPHVTVGLGHKDDLDQLVADPFVRFAFRAESASIYQLGDLGTAQVQLWSSAGFRP